MARVQALPIATWTHLQLFLLVRPHDGHFVQSPARNAGFEVVGRRFAFKKSIFTMELDIMSKISKTLLEERGNES